MANFLIIAERNIINIFQAKILFKTVNVVLFHDFTIKLYMEESYVKETYYSINNLLHLMFIAGNRSINVIFFWFKQ